MVNYEEAKKIALESLGEMAIHINEAFETEDAYIFNDSEHEYASDMDLQEENKILILLTTMSVLIVKNIDISNIF